MDVEETLREDLDRLASGIDATGITPTTIRRRMRERVRRRRLDRAVASGGLVVVVAIVLGPLGLLESDDRRPVLAGPAAPTSTVLPGRAGVLAPTLVAPSALPGETAIQ